ncbi:MAG: hypothetical protein ACT4PX_00175 [Actinomycetota bacterium]
MRPASALALAAALALAGCSSGDGGEAPTTTREPASTTSAPASTTTTAGAAATPTTGVPTLGLDGIGALRLGMSRAAAEQTRMLGPVGPACELSGTTGADLLPPLEGSVEFGPDGRLESINLRAGATTAEGVAPTASLDEVRQAYDGRNGFTLTRDDSPAEVFGIFLEEASKGDASYTFDFDVGSSKASSVSVPAPAFCD